MLAVALFSLCLVTFKILCSSDILVHCMVVLLMFSLSTFVNICVRGKFMFFFSTNMVLFAPYDIL